VRTFCQAGGADGGRKSACATLNKARGALCGVFVKSALADRVIHKIDMDDEDAEYKCSACKKAIKSLVMTYKHCAKVFFHPGYVNKHKT